MTDPLIAVKPATGSSIYFACGAPGNDVQLRLARAWAKGIKGGIGDAVSFGAAGSFLSIHDALMRIRLKTPTLDLPDTSATGPTRGLPLHTLVIIGRRLPAEGQGLLLSGQLGFGQTDTILSSQVLSAFDGMATVMPQQTKSYDLALLGWTIFAKINSVVLIGIGAGDSLAALAQNLATRTRTTVFFYTDPIAFEGADDTVTRVVVGDGITPKLAESFSGAAAPPAVGPAEFFGGAQKTARPVAP